MQLVLWIFFIFLYIFKMQPLRIGKIVTQGQGGNVPEGHLGGFTRYGDNGTYYPLMWSYLVDNYNIKTVLDIGCGKGYSSAYFKSLGCTIRGIDGSLQAQSESLIPTDLIVHDYTSGNSPLHTEQFDLCWSCEFVEHVEESYVNYFLNDFNRCKYIAMTFAGPNQGGYHHVNCQPAEYWIDKIQHLGYSYMSKDTELLKGWVKADRDIQADIPGRWLGLHFMERGLFFARNN